MGSLSPLFLPGPWMPEVPPGRDARLDAQFGVGALQVLSEVVKASGSSDPDALTTSGMEVVWASGSSSFWAFSIHGRSIEIY